MKTTGYCGKKDHLGGRLEMSEKQLKFRYAKRNDAALVLKFIRELAAYENMEREVTATTADLEEWIFDKKKAEVIFAVIDSEEIGFALFYVKPQYRGNGYGKSILKKLAQIAVERGCGRLEWWCLDWNKPSIDFYLSLGAKAMEDWTVYRIAGETLKQLSAE